MSQEIKPFSARSQAGFTLMEAMIVLGIIAVLFSLIMPAIKQVQVSAQRLSCASRERQIAMAVLMYPNEHVGRLPLAYLGIPTDENLNYVASEGLGRDKKSYVNPAFAGQYILDFNATDRWASNNNIYSKNYLVVCPSDTRAPDPYLGRFISYGANSHILKEVWRPTPTTLPGAWSSTKLAQVTNAGQRALIADTNNPRWIVTWDPPVTNDQTAYGSGIDYIYSARHNGTNLAFFDGHVEFFANPRAAGFDGSYLYFLTDPSATWPFLTWPH